MRRPATPICIGGLTLVALSLVSLFVGVIDMSPNTLVTDPEAMQLLLISRMPRTLAVLITGATLAMAGMILQVILRNRFVEPMTTGTGQGAALGILIATFLFPTAPLFLRMCVASATALAAAFGFILIAQRLPATQPLMVALVGLVYGGLLGAVMTLFAYQFDMLQYIEIWMNGEFSGVLKGRYELLWIAALAGLLIYLIADQLAIVGMGRTVSVSLGLNYRQILALGLLAISVVSALTVITVGMIPFVGVIVPNIVSRRYGDNLRATLPMVAMIGAALVLASDIAGRILRYPFEVPVGTVLGVVGAVIFIVMLYSRGRHAY